MNVEKIFKNKVKIPGFASAIALPVEGYIQLNFNIVDSNSIYKRR